MVNISHFRNQTLPLVITPGNFSNPSLEELCNWLQNNIKEVFQQLYCYGGILFRDWGLKDVHDFKKTVEAIVPKISGYEGGDSPREKILDNIYISTSYPSEYDIPLHNEKSFSNSRPSLGFFFCDIAPEIGGATPIADGRKFYKLMKQDILKKFTNKKLKYVMNLHSGYGIGKSWQECFETDSKYEVERYLSTINANFYWKDDESIKIEEIVDPILRHPVTSEIVFFSQADQWHPSSLDKKTYESMHAIIDESDFYHNVFYGDSSSLALEDLDFIRKLVVQESVSFKWQKGDLLMIDNILTLHGRHSYKGERRILVTFADFIMQI